MESKYSRLQNFLEQSKTNEKPTETNSSWSFINRIQTFVKRPSNSTSEGSTTSPDDFQILLQKADQDPILPSLTRTQRIIGFMFCLSLGILCMSLASLYIPVLVIKGRKFAFLFSFGSLFFLGSFSMLWGPMNHFNHLIHIDRLPFSLSYLVTLIGTIYYSVWVKSSLFTFIFVFLQATALIWYVISYIPGGARGLKFFSKLFYTFVSKGVSTTLTV